MHTMGLIRLIGMLAFCVGSVSASWAADNSSVYRTKSYEIIPSFKPNFCSPSSLSAEDKEEKMPASAPLSNYLATSSSMPQPIVASDDPPLPKIEGKGSSHIDMTGYDLTQRINAIKAVESLNGVTINGGDIFSFLENLYSYDSTPSYNGGYGHCDGATLLHWALEDLGIDIGGLTEVTNLDKATFQQIAAGDLESLFDAIRNANDVDGDQVVDGVISIRIPQWCSITEEQAAEIINAVLEEFPQAQVVYLYNWHGEGAYEGNGVAVWLDGTSVDANPRKDIFVGVREGFDVSIYSRVAEDNDLFVTAVLHENTATPAAAVHSPAVPAPPHNRNAPIPQ